MNISDVCIIRARQRGDDYCFDGFKKMGYDILIPYIDKNLFLRCMREVWFRLDLPRKDLWYNKKIKKLKKRIIIVKDPLIIPEFMNWLKQIHPDVRIILDYDNRVFNSVNPNRISDKVAEKWSYDMADCIEYGMHRKKDSYWDIYAVKHSEHTIYDVLYLGRDKGRADQLLKLEKRFRDMGLKTYFHICADRSFLRFKKRFYKPYMPYSQYLNILRVSKAILNIVPDGQTGLTMREHEAVFNSVKCITNNVGVLDYGLYHPSRYFILGKDDMNKLTGFLETPFLEVRKEDLENYTVNHAIQFMCEYGLQTDSVKDI